MCQRPLTPPLPCWQSCYERTWLQRRSRSRLRAQGQLDAASAQVGCLGLEPALSVRLFVNAHIDTPTLSQFPTPPLAHRLGGNNIGDEGATALAAILKETQIINLGCAAARVFAFVSMPVDTPHHPPPLPCSQSLEEQPWSQRRSRSRQGPEGQLHAAITRVRRLWLEPTPKCSPSCQRPLTLLTTHLRSRARSLSGNELGPKGAASLAEGLQGNSTLQVLK